MTNPIMQELIDAGFEIRQGYESHPDSDADRWDYMIVHKDSPKVKFDAEGQPLPDYWILGQGVTPEAAWEGAMDEWNEEVKAETLERHS